MSFQFLDILTAYYGGGEGGGKYSQVGVKAANKFDPMGPIFFFFLGGGGDLV